MATVEKVQQLPKIKRLKRVAAYCRVSCEKDTMLQSLSNQISHYSKLIQSTKGWKFAGVYADEAKTGTKDTRPEFVRMIADAKAGKIDLIITKSMSRFARNTLTMLQVTRELKAIGVDVFFQSENLHSISPEGEFMLTVIASIAQEESRQVSENMKWRIKQDFQQGIMWGGKDCYGYRVVDKKLVVVPEEAEIVKKIFQWYLEGWGTLTIAKELNRQGIPTLKGCKWNGNSILNILSCLLYTGDLILQTTYRENHITKKTKTNYGEYPKYYIENDHEPIISMETFTEAMDIRKARQAYYKTPVNCHKNYPFTGIMQCGKCGGRYKHKMAKGKPVWICTTYNSLGKDECASRQIPEDALYQAINSEFGYTEFNADDFRARVKQMVVFDGNRIELHFVDGTVKDIFWKDKPVRSVWTEEMREQARQYANKRWHGGNE